MQLRRALALAISCLAAACGGDEPHHDNLGFSEQGAVLCPDGPTVKGIDVSYYQGNVDWKAVKESGRVFAFARVNHGSFIDPDFQKNWAGMKNAGILRGPYQYFDPGGNAVAQAQIMVDEVGELGPGDLPAVLDIEETDGVGAATIADKMQKWLDIVEQGTKKRPIIYTGRYFWSSYVHSGAFDEYPLWIANWYTDCPDIPNAWNEWYFWQHSATGSVPGISGDVDLDRFNGTLADLEAFAGKVFAAEVVSLDVPEVMDPGSQALARITLKNAGGKGWGPKVALGTTKPRDRESPFADPSWLDPTRPVAVTENVPVGEESVFEVMLYAPDEPGDYVEHFNLVHETAGWFSDPPQAGPKDAAIALSISVAGDPTGDAPDPPGDEAPPAAEAEAELAAACQLGAAPAHSAPAWMLLAAALLALGWRRRAA